MQIVRDTREQLKWEFDFYDNVSVVEEKLDAGDYTRADLIGRAVIERKRNPGELYLNLATKVNKERFYKEIEKLKELDFAEIVCEFPEHRIAEFPRNSGIPKHRWKYLRVGAKYFIKLVKDVERQIPIVYCQDAEEAEAYAYRTLASL